MNFKSLRRAVAAALISASLLLVTGCVGESEPGEHCVLLADATSAYASTLTTRLALIDSDPRRVAAEIVAAGVSFREQSETVPGARELSVELNKQVEAISVAAGKVADSGLSDATRVELEEAVDAFGAEAPQLLESCVSTLTPTPSPQ